MKYSVLFENKFSYAQFCRPQLTKQLSVLGLDVYYHRANKNYLYYLNDNQEEVAVLDFVGGYGALFYGHNFDHFTSIIQDSITNSTPFLAQGSIRNACGNLGNKLNELLKDRFQQDYKVISSNSGTEAVEVCLKHARLNYKDKKNQAISNIVSKNRKIIGNFEKNELELDKSTITDLNKVLGSTLKFSGDLKSIGKLINEYNLKLLKPKAKVIALESAFHGKTSGALQLTHFNGFKIDKVDHPKNIIHIPINDCDIFEEKFNKQFVQLLQFHVKNKKITIKTVDFCKIACIMVEPMQGEGGIHSLSIPFVKCIQKLSIDAQVPIAVDEIQSGLGRTGTLFYSEQLGLSPDYLILSKSLGGGVCKIGATCIKSSIFGNEFDLIQSSTFAEDEVSSQVATKALELINSDPWYLESVNLRGEQIIKGLKAIKLKFPKVIKEVRGVGLMIGLEFHSQDNSFSTCLQGISQSELLGYSISGHLFFNDNIRVLPCLSNKNTLRFEPSVFISEENCDKLLSAIEIISEIIDKQNVYELNGFIIGKSRSKREKIKSYKIKESPIPINHSKKVSFIGHAIHAEELIYSDESFENCTVEEMEQYFELTCDLVNVIKSETKTVTSLTGEKIQLDFYALPYHSKQITVRMKSRSTSVILDKIESAVRMAENNQSTVMGFGGYSSIVTGNCTKLKETPVGLTTGNSFTTAMGITALLNEADRMEIDVSNAVFAAVGASGNICSVFSEILAEKARKVILIGRNNNQEKLKPLALKIFKNAIYRLINAKESYVGIEQNLFHSKTIKTHLGRLDSLSANDWNSLYTTSQNELGDLFPITVSGDLKSLVNANLILGGSNSSSPLIFKESLGTHPVAICDVALPADVDESVKNLNNVSVIQGGLVSIPNDPNYKVQGVTLEPGLAYACMCETLLLGLEGSSIMSSRNITPEQVKSTLKMSEKHGFKLGASKLEPSY